GDWTFEPHAGYVPCANSFCRRPDAAVAYGPNTGTETVETDPWRYRSFNSCRRTFLHAARTSAPHRYQRWLGCNHLGSQSSTSRSEFRDGPRESHSLGSYAPRRPRKRIGTAGGSNRTKETANPGALPRRIFSSFEPIETCKSARRPSTVKGAWRKLPRQGFECVSSRSVAGSNPARQPIDLEKTQVGNQSFRRSPVIGQQS